MRFFLFYPWIFDNLVEIHVHFLDSADEFWGMPQKYFIGVPENL